MCFLRPERLTAWSHSQQKVLTQLARESLYSLLGGFFTAGGVASLGFLKTGELEVSPGFLFLLMVTSVVSCWASRLEVILTGWRVGGDWWRTRGRPELYTHTERGSLEAIVGSESIAALAKTFTFEKSVLRNK